MRARQRFAVPATALLLGLLSTTVFVGPAAAVNDMTDGIAPGVVKGNDGFGTTTVIVPANGYVTYFVQGEPSLAGTIVEVWTNTSGTWQKATTRSFAADATLHYPARVSGRIGFQARIPGTPGGHAHGRSATNWPAGDARSAHVSITLSCDDFTEDDLARPGSSVLVERTVAVKSGTRLDVVLCSNPSTGFEWEEAAFDSAHLRLLGHREVDIHDIVGAPQTEVWSFQVVGHGNGYGMMAYSRPFAGGEKAVWSFVLTTQS
jgi:predicted secreted protein